MSKKSFVKGAAVLGIAGLLVKILGAVFRIPLGNMVSESSMAYYQPAYYIYTFFVVISTSGIPVAISRLVSEKETILDYRGAHRVFRVSMYLMVGIGIVSFLIVFLGAGPLANIMNTPNAKFPMMVIAPALLLVPMMAAYRGYFQGTQNMNPTAVSQVFEQVFRVSFGLALAYILYRSTKSVFSWAGATVTEASDVKGAMGAISGATIGSIAGLLVILLIYSKSKRAIKHKMHKYPETVHESTKTVLKKVLVIAIPITIGAAIMPIMNMVEVPIINNRLVASGFSQQETSVLYGMFSGYITSLINLPQVLTQALAMSLVPLISSLFKSKDKDGLHYNTTLGMRIAMMVGLPCAFGMAALSGPILKLLYPAKADLAANGAGCFAILAIGVIFLSITQTLTAVLQGVGKQMIPVRNLCVAIVIKIVVTFALTGIHGLNIKGAAIGTVVAYLVAGALNILAIKKYVGVTFPKGLCYVRPGISALAMGLCALLTYKGVTAIIGTSTLGNMLGTVVAIGIGVIIYAILLVVTKSITREDLLNMPKGGKLVKVYDKFVRK